MSDRSIPTAGRAALAVSLVLLALSCALLWRASRLTDRGLRAIAVAEARQEARRAVLDAAQDRLEKEIAAFKAVLDRMIEAEGERARRARRAPWEGMID